jgi:uncharacterized membrane protein YGL010W
MKTLEQWLNLYARDHKHPTNQLIHKVCVPAIMLSLFGLLWSIPTLEFMGPINWAMLFCLPCLAFYSMLSMRATLLMFFVSLIMLTVVYFIDQSGNLLRTSTTIFIVAWIIQFIGHKIEGQKPSFLEDLQFLLIGPLWVFKKVL